MERCAGWYSLDRATELIGSIVPASCPYPASVLLLNLPEIFILLRKQKWFSVTCFF